MTNPRPIGERELTLIHLYVNCQLELQPRSFYTKWDVTYEEIAYICSRDPSTVQHWFSLGRHYHPPTKCDMRHLALMDFVLEHFEKIPPELFNLLCPRRRR